MKQYIMGMITGASLLACVFMFMGVGNRDGQNHGKWTFHQFGESSN